MSKEIFENIKKSVHPTDELVTSFKVRINKQNHIKSIQFHPVVTCVILISLIFSTFVIINHFNNNAEPVIERISGSCTIDVYNPKAVVGDVDYVFVGYVNEKNDTVYRFQKDDPYTNYSVIILENIKGNLVKDEPISIQKYGGISKDGDCILLAEDDYLPEQGKIYIFTVRVQDDGCLLVSGPNSSIVLEDVINQKIDVNTDNYGITEDILNSSKLVSTYKDAVVNQIKSNRQNKKSILEISSDESNIEINESVNVDSSSK